MARTVLRVKRRRDDPIPPSTFKLQPESRKRRRGEEDDEETNELTNMLSSSHFLQQRNETLPTIGSSIKPPIIQQKVQPILFHKVETVTSHHKRKSHPDDHVQVVDATLDFYHKSLPQSIVTEETVHSSKKPRISLQMIDTKIMSESEFWRQHSSTENTQDSKEEKGSFPKKELRARMRRTVSKMSTLSNTSNISSKGKKILDPISRQIQDGLSNIHSVPSTQVTEAIIKHVQLLLQYPEKVNVLCSNGSGTILHACALYNTVEGTKYLLDNLASKIDFQKRDSDHHTALQIAHSVGSRGVVDVIQSYWSGDDGEDFGDEERDEDFIYDVYCVDDHHHTKDGKVLHAAYGHHLPRMPQGHLEHHPPGELLSTESLPKPVQSPIPPLTTPQNSMNLDPSYPPSTASHLSEDGGIPPVISLKGGFGYWNQDGELVLDIHPDADMADSDLEDDEYDSNREDCDANEYPDDDDLDDLNNSDHEVGHHFHANIERGTGMCPPRFANGHLEDNRMHQYEDSDEEGDYYYDQTTYMDFRNRPVDLENYKLSGTSNGFVSSLHDENDDNVEGEEEYSGIMYGADSGYWSNERIYCETEAFDPIMDGDDSD